MRAAAQPPTEPRPGARRRAISLGLTIAVHLLLVLLLVRLAPQQMPPPAGRAGPTTVTLIPNQPEATPSSAKKAAKASAAKAQTATAARIPPPRRPPPQPTKTPPPLAMLPIELATSDIGRIPSPSRDRAGPPAPAGGGSGADSGDTNGPGAGPGGETLYNAEWQREPTHAELVTYMPANPPDSGWGLIACRTVEQFRVEDCRQIGESPSGSGLARAIRQAAWQFRVRPPRIGGKPMVGAWVRIRIDFDRERVIAH